ncbi:MAG: bifunctional (p)ppGpp synthetase/guanosine-3',5'-bis(diphosphate) 3'-pyrophosphohydrolase [Gammaproteobacteria bacterium]|nr:bifunctional (p)ppGpp synthetase/guanosine-3',5'-bis(diphosphate) 3'-pyrophosphohydrolase [Gammaproteobacteria bacterium]
MQVSPQEKAESEQEAAGLPAAARAFIATLPPAAGLGEARARGEAVLAIVEPFALPGSLKAAILLYPLLRDELLSADSLAGTPLATVAAEAAGLAQLGRFELPADWRPGEALATSQSDALRRMLLSVVSDPRLVLARIGEQLHRLREAKSAPLAEQKRLAVETQEIYGPLASRLGVWQLKWELEDLAFRYLDPERYKTIARALNEKRAEREHFLEDVKVTLQRELQAAGIDAEISARPKHIYSIWRKMRRKGIDLDQIFDMRAIRVFVRDVTQCYAALGIVHNLWPYLRGEFDDYIANPKDNNYQSLHTTVIGPGGKTLEVQIRTFDMHRHAELGVAAHWRYKEGGGAVRAFDQKIRFLRQLLEPTETDSDLLDQLRDDVFEDRVYAVSPKGDVVELPAGATPLDFAYHVHTQVGHRCRGAKVNGRIVPLTYTIRNADRIEIITGPVAQPSRDWLNPQLRYLASSRSRTKVRNWFRQQDKEQNRRQGREIVERELARLNARDIPIERIAAQARIEDPDSLYSALGSGDLTSAAIANAVQQLRREAPPDEIAIRRPARRDGSAAEQIAVLGVGDLMCNFARCCRPVPPEKIVGYITQARGVSIHRDDCGNFRNLNARNPERVIDVSWGKAENADYPVDLTIQAFDRHGLLRDISGLLADERVDVESLQTRADPKNLQVIMQLSISVPDLPTLSRVISRLEQLPNVSSVRRRT